jgi:hypothetical protein
MTVLSTANALLELFEHSKDSLTTEKLEWFGRLTIPAQAEIINIAKSIENLAMIHGCRDQSDLPSVNDLSCILFGLSDQITNVNAIWQIAEEASYIVGERKTIEAKNKSKQSADHRHKKTD